MGLISLGWFWKAVGAALFIAPAFLTIPFFAKNFQVKPEVFTTWYFGGVSFGVAAWISFSGRATSCRAAESFLRYSLSA